MSVQLFDKIVNVSLFRSDGKVARIICPDTGRKPTIRLSGDMVSNDVISQVELRITNFVTDVPLSEYTHKAGAPLGSGGRAVIEAGYKGTLMLAFEGEIINGFQESPGPDGVAAFQMLVGYFTDWTTRTLNAWYEAGTPVSSVLSDVASKLGMSLLYYADPSLVIPPPGMGINGLAKEAIAKLKKMFGQYRPDGDWSGLSIRPDGATLIATSKDLGTGITYVLNYVSLVNHNAAGFNVQAPWVPSIRPGDSIQIDPMYFRQDFGGALVSSGNTFRVLRVTFDFCTTDNTGMMTLVTVAEADIPQSHIRAIPTRQVIPMRPM